ncbi:putative cardiolipin synthase YwiE [Caulifigura coniformis]|uniref:Cardiolipin synthase n=1 Tax=Caulifigura coniformis TaxID=2527983 RepID=A0A517SKD7_9PLAN|nr:cardiolipin synthase [Caulifigura coniformis]QDT56589.1 putative cardiolipin synthase YwiE [Caulifigura coniformis]
MFSRSLDWLSARFPSFGALYAWAKRRRRRLIIGFVMLMHTLGAISSIQAVMSTRTPQGAIAWAISLNTIPYIAVPAYWVFGQSHFDGYEFLRYREMLSESSLKYDTIRKLREKGLIFEPQTERQAHQQKLLERLAMMPILRSNDVDLLVDGQATFDAIVDGINSAKDYILFQFYILRSDGLGNRLKDALLARARQGVKVYMLYDAMGSKAISAEYVLELQEAGVKVAAFEPASHGWRHRLRMNFRNHRKIVVIDGKEAFVGGHNVGDEYVGKHPTLTPWRDTHVAVRGPIVLATQVSFAEDWMWVTGDRLSLNWEPEPAPKGEAVAACFPTGPADELETGTLLMLDAINMAQKRIWIASPYFVPDAQFVSTLQLAALRGVDVRVLIPENNDDSLVDLTSYSYLEELGKAGIPMYRYQPGFMHQKVMLIDDDLATVGTANFDNRSMRLNFEITLLFRDAVFASQVEAMLEDDFTHSRLVSTKEYSQRRLPFRFSVQAARLLAPVQ